MILLALLPSQEMPCSDSTLAERGSTRHPAFSSLVAQDSHIMLPESPSASAMDLNRNSAMGLLQMLP